MLNRLSLLKKFIIGFTLILALLVALAIVGYQGVSGVVQHNRVSDAVNAIGSRLTQARLFQQAFVISRADDDIQRVRETLETMKNEIGQTADAFPEQAIGQQMADIRQRTGEYEQAFDAYVQLVGDQSKMTRQMDVKARSALDLTSRIRDREQSQLESIQIESERIIAEKTALADAATQIYNTALEAKVSRVSLMSRNELSTMAQWKGDNKKLEGQVIQIRSQLKDPETQKLADRILELQKVYMDDVLGYLRSLAYDDLNRMIKSVKDYTWSITSLQFELRQQLDFYMEDTRVRMDQMLAVTRSVDAMANLLMNARLQEKEIVASRDTTAAGEVAGNIEAIIAAEAEMKEKVEDEGIHAQIAPIVTASSEYGFAFEETVALMDRQRQAEARMVAAALDVERVCTAARSDQQAQTDRQIGRSNWLMLIGTLAAIAVGILCAVASAFIVVRPIQRTADMLKDIAEGEGDLTQRLDVESRDEIGQMGNWFNAFISKLHDIVKQITGSFEAVSASASQLLTISRQMDDGIHDLSDKSAAVSRAADEMSQNMNSVAAASEQASTNVNMVASAMETMNQSVAAISQSAAKAREMSRSAVDETRQASSKVDSLGAAATQINKVTQVITDISDQTNLLALNATIEAARAGEAGKGFAVVANEIKDLARQTAEATKGIKSEIEGIQNSTAQTVADIGRIADVIGNMDEVVSTIAEAVDEQSATTSEIAENVLQASSGIAEVNENMAQSSSFSQQIASEIGEVNRIATMIADNSTKVSSNAGDLNRLSKELHVTISAFKIQRAESAGPVPAEKGADLIVWDERLQFGIEAIDRQHHRLVDLINRLYNAMRNRAGNNVLAGILDELADYTVEHFKDEEALMQAAGYADLEAHQRVHEKLVQRVLAFKQDFDSGSAGVSLELMNFLSDWLVNHIKGVDRRYVAAVKAHG